VPPTSTGSLARRARGVAVRAASSRHTPLYRSSYALILTTVVNAGLGLLFWVAAARLYPTAVVGLGAGGISAMQLVATVGWVGLIFTLMRYVPIAGRARRRLLAGVYLTGVGVTVPLAVVLAVGIAPDLDVGYLGVGAPSVLAFCACVGIWVVFTLQDSALISLRRAGVVTVENLLYGALKLLLLVALVSVARPWVLLGVWGGSALLFVVVVSGFVIPRHPLMRDDRPPAQGLSKGVVARFSAGHTAAAFIAIVPDYLVPLLVLRYLDPAANAYFYAAWSVSLSARALSVNVTDALMVEAAYGQESFVRLLRRLARLLALVLVPTILVMVLAADQILRVFGPAYAEQGAGVLRLFAVGLIPFTVVTLALALDRTRQRFADALVITAVGTVATLGLDVLLIPRHGLSGAGVGWLCGQTLAALVAARTLAHGTGGRATPGVRGDFAGRPGEQSPSDGLRGPDTLAP
jgi:O-antigen/teichoic acid export membrane protein